MGHRYELYCLADPVFYDLQTPPPQATFDRGPPAGWERSEMAGWIGYRPIGVPLPSQGWKIHVSASLDDAESTLTQAWDYCVRRRLAFKFLRSRQTLLMQNAKSAERSASGKFITIYPDTEDALRSVLHELGSVLAGARGPAILSDLRWGDGPLYVRYGGFIPRLCPGPDGSRVPALEDSQGRLVPDHRGVTFQHPPWVRLPPFLVPHLIARSRSKVDDAPYRIEEALHFSNAGGVYRGTDPRTGEAVLIKEARPHAGLAIDGSDAVARLACERAILEHLAGLEVVPRLRDTFILDGHHFLVEDLVEGTTLNSMMTLRYPLVVESPEEAAVAEYTAWALEMCRLVEQAVAAVHDRGVISGDIHPANVMVTPDNQIVLLDWEAATLDGDRRRRAMGAPGFAAPMGRRGVEADRYSLACMRFFCFMPLTRLFALDHHKPEHLAAEITRLFPVPEAFFAEAITDVQVVESGSRAGTAPQMDDWTKVRKSLSGAILASATPGRDDRLFPGDVAQFASGGTLNLNSGAAGVLYTLDSVGCGRFPEHEEWLVERTARASAGTPLGFYDGLHGVAYALDRLGRTKDALGVLDRCLDEASRGWEEMPLDLYGGLAGMALNLVHFEAAADWVAKAVDLLASRLASAPDLPGIGLMWGASGPALFCIRLYELTADPALLDVAAAALRLDLHRCLVGRGGGLEVDDGRRTLPYLAQGSAGIGMVLADYLTHRVDEELADAATAIKRATGAQFCVHSGLFSGRAGLLVARWYTSGADDAVRAHIRRLAWHALSFRGHHAFPGDGLLRLSMDLGTGTAGVLLALGAAMGAATVPALPFHRRAKREQEAHVGP